MPSTRRVDVMGSPEALWSELTTLFNKQGDAMFDDDVTQRQHALQCATLAYRDAKSTPALITASLLHDIGHMLLDGDRTPAELKGSDTSHEVVASKWLSRNFPRAVTEPVRLHVAAKRYLCFSDPSYLQRLSKTSRDSMQEQGGAFTEAEADEFLAIPESKDAVAVRRFNDKSKDVGSGTLPLETFKAFIMDSYVRPELL